MLANYITTSMILDIYLFQHLFFCTIFSIFYCSIFHLSGCHGNTVVLYGTLFWSVCKSWSNQNMDNESGYERWVVGQIIAFWTVPLFCFNQHETCLSYRDIPYIYITFIALIKYATNSLLPALWFENVICFLLLGFFSFCALTNEWLTFYLLISPVYYITCHSCLLLPVLW